MCTYTCFFTTQMFTLNEKYEINRNILKCDYIRYRPSENSTIKTANSQIHNKIPREDSVVALLNSYLELIFDVLQAATNNRYADVNDIRLVNLGPIALFSKYNLTASSWKQLENFEHGHIACLMHKLLTTARGCDDMSFGFDRSRDRRQRELSNNKSQKGKNHVGIYLNGIFGYAQLQLKGTYGLGYLLTITRNIDSAVLNKDNAINKAKDKINRFHWYVPHYTPSIAQQAILFKQIQSRTTRELKYPKKTFF